jgi:hypothetical protein
MIDHMRLSSIRSRRSLGMKRMITVADFVFCVCLSSLCSGCLALAVGAAGGAAGAVYVMGKLQDEVNRPLPLFMTLQLPHEGFRIEALGGSIDKISAHMESRFPMGRMYG